ncbi:DUF4411 family protein [Acinetobacter baumannii]|mgnify:CR=1 FL=1|nr:DUF4411 family protein [Acinetobacter baumannii]
MNNVKYLFDANIFIDAHNLHYHPCFCDLFWNWLNDGHQANHFFSLDRVKEEIAKPSLNNELAKYVRAGVVPNNFFLDSLSNASLIDSYTDVIKWANNHGDYIQKAKDDFADATKADAFLISVAKVQGFTIITNEVSQPEEKKRIRIPDVAKHFGVHVTRLPNVLKLHSFDNFKFQ